MERIEIYSSKKKSLLLLIGSIAFVVLGFWLLLEADNLTGWRARNPIITRGIGIASILFFGLGVFVGIKRLIKSEIALIIDRKGLNVNPKKSLNEYINWSDINGFEEVKIQSTRIVIIGVKNPEYWLDKETSGFRRKLMQFNISNYNSPFNIAASGLDISSDKLIETLNNYYDRHKNEA
ncbi:MAG TPA: STM3941 family protein [Stenomitos sp.]